MAKIYFVGFEVGVREVQIGAHPHDDSKCFFEVAICASKEGAERAKLYLQNKLDEFAADSDKLFEIEEKITLEDFQAFEEYMKPKVSEAEKMYGKFPLEGTILWSRKIDVKIKDQEIFD